MTQDREQDIEGIVDEIVDDLDPDRIESEAERLGLTVDELVQRVFVELKARLTGFAQ